MDEDTAVLQIGSDLAEMLEFIKEDVKVTPAIRLAFVKAAKRAMRFKAAELIARSMQAESDGAREYQTLPPSPPLPPPEPADADRPDNEDATARHTRRFAHGQK